MKYPDRESFFSHRYCRLLTKAAVAQEIGPEACWLLTVIAHQEDAKKYRGPVTFYNGQLLPLCGFGSEGRLIRARDAAVGSGWLHYEQGGKRRPGIYWCVIPNGLETVSDSPMDEGTPVDFNSQNGSGNESQNEIEQQFPIQNARENEGKTKGKRSANGGPSTLFPIPIPNREASASADACPEQGETPAPSHPSDELTEFVFECSGVGGKSWTLPRSKLNEYLESYPGLDVRAEIRKARQWIRDNPKKRKTAGRGTLSFLTSWLNRSQNSGRANYGNRNARGPQIGPGQSYDPNHGGAGEF